MVLVVLEETMELLLQEPMEQQTLVMEEKVVQHYQLHLLLEEKVVQVL